MALGTAPGRSGTRFPAAVRCWPLECIGRRMCRCARKEMPMPSLFDPHELGHGLVLKNRVVMAPMTRTRTSEGDAPNALMATYYGQRAGAGLIVSEATDVAPHSKGYSRTPGIHT